jgi:hypothetical protein
MRAVLILSLAAACAGRTASGPGGGATSKGGDAWARVHRLIDHFDSARFARSAESRAQLGRAMGDDSGTGPAATDRALDFLLLEVDKLLAADRLHADAQAAKTLLEFDRTPPTNRAEVWQRMVEIKAIARGSGSMAPNARLRLAAYCWRALSDATRAPIRHKPFAVAHCLYPLYDADPEPYFSPSADRRPPLPPWPSLQAGAAALLEEGESLEGARRTLRDDLASLGKAANVLPVEPDISDPMWVVEGAPLYDWAPVFRTGVSEIELRAELQADGRGQVTLDLNLGSKGEDVLHAARSVAAAGANEIQLLVRRKQSFKAPKGDFWHGKPDTVFRAAVIPISLAPLGKAAATGARSPRDVDFAGGLELHLVIGAGKPRLVGEGGEISGPLADALTRVRAAFPDQQALALVIEPTARYEDVVAAAAAARSFRLGLADKAPKASGKSLARRVAVRAGAEVKVVPDSLAPRRAALLACYRDLLEKAPTLAGTVRLEAKNGKPIVVSGDKRLAKCATGDLAGATSAEITFSARR